MPPVSPPRLAAGSAGGTPEGSELGEAADGSALMADEDRQAIRQELFLGHLLTLAASTGAVPPHALPSIAAMLQVRRLCAAVCSAVREGVRHVTSQSCHLPTPCTCPAHSLPSPAPALPNLQSQHKGLVPKWLAFTLTQQPALFDRAFSRCFSKVGAVREQCMSRYSAMHNPVCTTHLAACLLLQELEMSQQEADEADDPMAWAVQRFWKRRAAPLMPSRSFGHLRRWAAQRGRFYAWCPAAGLAQPTHHPHLCPCCAAGRACSRRLQRRSCLPPATKPTLRSCGRWGAAATAWWWQVSWAPLEWDCPRRPPCLRRTAQPGATPLHAMPHPLPCPVCHAAINRLDGRQYAVKKIPLDMPQHSAGAVRPRLSAHACGVRRRWQALQPTALPARPLPRHPPTHPPTLPPPGAYARIMREVTTLSRLQNLYIVRYFQVLAWGCTGRASDWPAPTLDPTRAATPVPPRARRRGWRPPPRPTAAGTTARMSGGQTGRPPRRPPPPPPASAEASARRRHRCQLGPAAAAASSTWHL